MKKTVLSIFFIVVIFVVSSCSPRETDILSYQTYPITTKGSLFANDTEYIFEMSVSDAGTAELKFSMPETLRGYIFNVTPSGATLSYGDTTIDFNGNGEKTNIVTLLPSLFSLKNENLISKTQQEQNSVPITVVLFNTEKGELKVYINENTNTPMRFELKNHIIDLSEFINQTAEE